MIQYNKIQNIIWHNILNPLQIIRGPGKGLNLNPTASILKRIKEA